MDGKITVSIDACLPEMIIAETIYNEYGAVIVWENTRLDKLTIAKLQNFGIKNIRIYESSLNSRKNQKMQEHPGSVEEIPFSQSYERDTDALKSVLHDLSRGQTVSLEKTAEIANSVYARKNDNREIIQCITQFRKVDEYTYYHCVNVSFLAMLTGRWLKLKNEEIHLLVVAGLLHDIGKSRVPAEIINKPGKLTEEEFLQVKKHAEYGYNLLQCMKDIDPRVCEAVLFHHEREDGSGYPHGLHGSQIPKFAKIIAIADTYDAMTANRSYKPKESPFRVFELMQNGCFGYLDPVVLDTFLANISHYYVGYHVKLNDGRTAEVVYINRQQYGRPVLKIGNEYLDLAFLRDIVIEE